MLFLSCPGVEFKFSCVLNSSLPIVLPPPAPRQVRLGTRHKALQHQAFALNSSRCQELANYYFGFNGWSKRIIKVNLVHL